MKSKDYGLGIFSLFAAWLFIFNIGTCSKSDDDFKLIEGHIIENAVLHSGVKKPTYYTFQIDKRPYHQWQFSTYYLQSMRYGVDYPALLKKGNTVKVHILKGEGSKIYSLAVDGKEIVPLENRRFFDFKNLLMGLFFLAVGLLIFFGD